MAVRIADIIERFGGELKGDGSRQVTRFATLLEAGPGELAFFANPKYKSQLAETRAGCVILRQEVVECPTASITVADPYLYYAKVAQWLGFCTTKLIGIDPTARLSSPVPDSVSVSAGACIGIDAVIGERVFVGPNAVIGDRCVIGDDCVIHANTTLYADSRLGQRVVIHSGAVIGADGFGYAREADGAWVKIPQTGGVRIGDDVEIGAGTTIDRGALGDTVIGRGVKLDNQIQIGHNVQIGEHTAMAGCVGIAGSARIGARCTVGGGAVILGHLEIADDVNVSAGTLVAKPVPRAGTYTGAVPMQEHRDWLRNFSRLRHLDHVAEKITIIEQRLSELERNK